MYANYTTVRINDEQAARALAERAVAQTSDDAPATIESIETREIIEHARA